MKGFNLVKIGKYILVAFLMVLIYLHPLKVYAMGALDKVEYLSAWASLAVYDDKFGMVARKVMEENGWQIDSYNHRIGKSDVKYLLADKEMGDHVIYIIAIAGTSNLWDVKTDLLVEGTAFEPRDMVKQKGIEKKIPWVHKGFYDYMERGFCAGGKDDVAKELLKVLQANPQDKIYLTGHSLGGAVAELLAARLVDMGLSSKQLTTVTFGAPAVGNEIFVEKYEPKINLHRITIAGDPVKNLSQIANRHFVQFKTNEQWQLNPLEQDKFPHNILLYFDLAMRQYYDEQKDSLETGNGRINQATYYVAPIKFAFPPELAGEIPYIKLAMLDKFRMEQYDSYLAEDRKSFDEELARAKAKGAKYLVVYSFYGERLRDSKLKRSYYLSGSKLIYDTAGNLIAGYSNQTDTKDKTVLQGVLYIDLALDGKLQIKM